MPTGTKRQKFYGPKRCARCMEIKAPEYFAVVGNGERNGVKLTRRNSYCRSCAKSKAWDDRHSDFKAWYGRQRKSYLRYRYGIETSEYEKIFKSQFGACAVCGFVNLEGKPLHIDHDHASGVVRGLLCGNCNRMLGLAMDKISTLNSAVDYLEKWHRRLSVMNRLPVAPVVVPVGSR